MIVVPIGNNYRLWIIASDGSVCAVVNTSQLSPISDPDFAVGLAISPNGTIWALSTQPDPQGGSGLLWTQDGTTWSAINNSAPGGIQIAGYVNDSCVYLTEDGDIYFQDTMGNNRQLTSGLNITDMDFGAGYFWAIFPATPGGIPVLQVGTLANNQFSWKTFNTSMVPQGLSVSYSGDCYGIYANTPYGYYQYQQQTAEFGSGLNVSASQVTFKNWAYAITDEPTIGGNPVYAWVDDQGGIWQALGINAQFVAATFYSGS